MTKNRKYAVLLACVLAATSISADDDLARAVGQYKLVDWLSGSVKAELALSEDQDGAMKALVKEYRATVSEMLRGEGGEIGKPLTGDVLVVASRQPPGQMDKLRALEKEHHRNLTSILTEEQLNLAELLLLKRRFKAAGVDAIFVSNDLTMVSDLRLSAPLDRLWTKFDGAKEAADRELNQLAAAGELGGREFNRKRHEIRLREYNAVLNRLGEDGRKLQELIARVVAE